MKHYVSKLLVVTMLLSVGAIDAATVSGKSFFMPVANNGTAVNTLGWSGGVHKFDMDSIYGCFKVQSEYGQNTKGEEVGKYLLMNGTNSAIWGPSDTNGTTNDTDVSNINFLLNPVSSKITATFKPKAQDFVTNFSLFVGLDEWMEGLFLSANAPLQHARWETGITEVTNTAQTTTAFLDGDVTNGDTPTVPYTSVIAAFKGDKTVGDSVKWSYGRIDGRRSETKLGDVRVTLGYNFVNKETCHFGVGVQGLLGAGGKSKAEYVFAPVIGHAGRHGVGGMLDGAVRLYDKDADHHLTANLNASAVHLFDNEQRRSYDLTNCGKWSRYNLVKKFTAVATTAVYAGVLDNMINIGSLKAKIGVDVVYDANLAFCYQMGNMSVDLGYQLSGHGKEKHKSWVDTIAADTYGLYEFAAADTIAAQSTFSTDIVRISGDASGSLTAAIITTSNGMVVNNARLDKNSGLAGAALEHCVYGGLNYNWMDSDWAPGVGVFGSYHISGDDNNSLDRWSVGFQGNVSF